jgi:phenylalanyl-tRNA synthetase alpha chain
MESKIQEVLLILHRKINSAKSLRETDQLYIETFGKKGSFTNLTKQIAKIPQNQRPKFGKLLNQTKKEIEALLSQKEKILEERPHYYIDITAPGKKSQIGHLHLVSQAIEEIVDIFKLLGFTLQSYPEVEWDCYSFESLNMPKNHPARDEWETFFIKAKSLPHLGGQVLKPHTSNGQVREMERIKKPPIRMLNIARCYRRQIDISHTPMFHQFEGLLIDKNISIPHLKGIFDFFISKFFGPQRQSRLRPYHFRFTEPSFEVDVTCSVCLGRGCRLCKDGWLELGGGGMVHPKVLAAGKIDSKIYSGLAFGWGVERTIAMRTDLPDIRLMYQNDIRFLEQF